MPKKLSISYAIQLISLLANTSFYKNKPFIYVFRSLQKEDNLQYCVPVMHLSGHSVFFFFFQGKSKENLALISHNSQWDPMVMKL